MKPPLPALNRALVVGLLTAVGLPLPAHAQTEAQLEIETYAGLTITGEIGKVYSVDYVSDLDAGEEWKCLEFIQLLESPHLWTDKSVPANGRRFYRAVEMEAPENTVWIPPGTFRMGSPTKEADRFENEGPQTEVTISRGFWMGRYEVTQGEYETVMGDNPSWHNGDRSAHPAGEDYGTDLNRPVERITWSDAAAYCAALTARERAAGRIPEGSAYQLPTDAQWEYAGRAWTSTRFCYGDDPEYTSLVDYAWFSDNSGHWTHPVGQKLPNPWGLYDIHGNVEEWTRDAGESSLPGGAVVDPERPVSIRVWYRTWRGGSCSSPGRSCRSAVRADSGEPDNDYGSSTLGFRVVLAPVVLRPQPNMVYIPPGTFAMGSSEYVPGRDCRGYPQTQVTLTKGFWVGRYELTQREYQEVMGENPSYYQPPEFPENLDRPVESVSWDNAVAYCQTLTDQELAAGRLPAGYEYRLPSEAQWEYACRAGTTSRFSFGDALDCDDECGPCAELDQYMVWCGNGNDRTEPVGTKLPNGV